MNCMHYSNMAIFGMCISNSKNIKIQNFSVKCPIGKMSVGVVSVVKISVRQNVFRPNVFRQNNRSPVRCSYCATGCTYGNLSRKMLSFQFVLAFEESGLLETDEVPYLGSIFIHFVKQVYVVYLRVMGICTRVLGLLGLGS